MSIFNKLEYIYRFFVKFLYKIKIYKPQKTRLELHEYWKNPSDAGNYASAYFQGAERSYYLLEIFESFNIDKLSSILEIGCNVGRNLNVLYSSGFKNLSAVEISTIALENFKIKSPEVFSKTKIFIGPVEEKLVELQINSMDVVFTMAVLEHIHDDVINEVIVNMIRTARKYIFLIEDEFDISERHFPRNYKTLFECHNIQQIYYERVSNDHRSLLSSNFVVRVFLKM